MTSMVQAAADLRAAIYAQATELFADEPVLVTYTDLFADYADDAVIIGTVNTSQEPATTNRGREVRLELDVQFRAFRPGDTDADQAAFARMVELASSLSEHLRSAAAPGNTSLGGAVRDCFEVEFGATSGEVQTDAGLGRLWLGVVIYEAHARLRG